MIDTRRQSKSRDHLHQIGERASFHFSHHLTAMTLNRDLTDANFPPTCLFIKPEVTSAMTSRSRRLSDAYRTRSACISAPWSRVVWLRASAFFIALNRASRPTAWSRILLLQLSWL